MEPFELTTARLRLRHLGLADFDAMREIHGDDETMSFYGGAFPPEKTTDWIERSLESYAENGFGSWAVLHREEARLVGLCGITYQLIDGERIPEIGYQFNRSFWGQGLATEAAIACRNYGFKELGFPRLVSWMATDNVSSRRVAERVGMKLWKEVVNPKSDRLHAVYAVEP
ncbi:MAG: GNAT family N-acetyltransferase [Verrucomicrobiota bacterium]